ncbi:MAG TPA: tyrosine recombinase XerC [Casimicrobiaceae bacterium]|nr:tyrosine recombinase XerC [Casimicrobiaceae bacterium]
MPAPVRSSDGTSADALVDAFSRHLVASPRHTRSAYCRDVSMLVALCADANVAKVSRADIARHLATLHARGLAGRSLARVLSAWRAFFRFLIERGHVAVDPCAGLKAPKAQRRLPSALTVEEAAKLCTIDGDDFLATRDRAIVELAYSSGLRLGELAGLSCEALNLAEREVSVIGKGAKERLVPVGEAAHDALQIWLRLRADVAKHAEHALFVNRRGERLSARAIERRLALQAVRQGLDRHVHPHMLRHSFASHVLQSSGDLRAVQELLGHASIASTQVYTHLDWQHLAKAYDAAHPRARKKKR